MAQKAAQDMLRLRGGVGGGGILEEPEPRVNLQEKRMPC